MATAGYPQRSYGYSGQPGPGSLQNGRSSRSPSPSGQRGYSPHHQTYDQYAPAGNYNNRDDRMGDVPDVRVLAPSRAGEENEDAYVLDDDRSVYSERMSAPQTFYSNVFQNGSREANKVSVYSTRSDASQEVWDNGAGVRPDSNVEPFSFMEYESRPQVPKVVVSSPSDAGTNRNSYMSEGDASLNAVTIMPDPTTPPPNVSFTGRVPSAIQGARNFSLPFSRPDRATPPHPPHPDIRGTEQEKREVLERNQRRHAQRQQSPHGSPYSGSSTPSTSYFPDQQTQDNRQPPPGQSWASTPHSPSSSLGMHSPPLNSTSTMSAASTQLLKTPQESQAHIGIPNKPAELRSSSTDSVYSMYSYYQLDSPGASPTAPAHDISKQRSPSPELGITKVPTSPPSSFGKKSPRMNQEQVIANPQTAEDYLQLGISHHEADRLQESAQCFEKAATLNGGCAVGMLMWGLSLRHGWGTQKDEQRAFKWLKKAAEHAVVDLQQGKNSSGKDVIKVNNSNRVHNTSTEALGISE